MAQTVNIAPYFVDNCVIVQQVSMRSYKTGEYNFHLDGNINLTLHRLFLTGVTNFTWVLPDKFSKIGLQYLKQVLDTFNINCNFVFIPYGKNAYENRKVVPISFNNLNQFDLKFYNKYIVSDFCAIPADLYTFNISKVPGLDRAYIDEFIELQQKAANRAPVIVLNDNQKQLLDGNIITQNYILDEDLLVHIFNNSLSSAYTKLLINIFNNHDKGFVFFPFRISDKAYKFEKVLEYCKTTNKRLLVTDVNDSLNEESKYIINLSKLFDTFDKKKLYFTILYLARFFDIKVICYEDIFEVMHQAPIELAYFLKDQFTMYGKDGKIIPNEQILNLVKKS